VTTAKRTPSIAFRLIAAVLAVELVSALAVIFLSLGYERHIHFRAFDVMLHGRADSVLGAVQDAEDTGDNVMLDFADLHVPPEDVYEVWDGRGHLLGRSSNWQGSSGNVIPPHDGISHLELSGRQYGLLRQHGSRIIDPGESGGGKLRHVTILYGAPTEHVWHAIRGAVEFYAAGSLLLLVVTGPLIAWLLHRGLVPLRQLASLASNVSVDSWEFDPPATARNTRELAPLTNAIESVLQRLELSFTQQRTFVSDAAHELKTAVAVVKSSLQLLELRPRSAPEYHTGIVRCLADTARLEELVAKMLTLARLESGTQPSGSRMSGDGAAATGAAHPRPFCNMAACLRETATQLETVAAQRAVRLVMEGEHIASPVTLRAEDCSLLISNLLLNALQHSPRESAVELRLTNTAGNAVLTIEDHGDGISSEALPHVFDRFYRGDPSRARSTGGVGLGLAICKAIVEKAGGEITIASTLGSGATVTVRLPLI
jgi:signal transduction histidine kinase